MIFLNQLKNSIKSFLFIGLLSRDSDFSFRNSLASKQTQEKNVLCVWLDPKMENIPEEFINTSDNEEVQLYNWMKTVVDISAGKWVTMFKPQSAHWEAIEWWKNVL